MIKLNYTFIEQSALLQTDPQYINEQAPYLLEVAARTCTDTTATAHILERHASEQFIKRAIMARKHYSVLEHIHLSFALKTTRALANQIVRHRLASYCQQSTRYVNKATGDKPVEIVLPVGFENKSEAYRLVWKRSVMRSVDSYVDLIKELGARAEEARDVLPLATATELYATWNLRELFHILHHPVSGRWANKHAQTDIRHLFEQVYYAIYRNLPFIFELAEMYREQENPNSAAPNFK